MKWLWIAFSVFFVLAAPAIAQTSSTNQEPQTTLGISPGELKPTPEMWFYQEQMRQYMDPKMAVRQKAEFKASQREARIAARQWFGFSNLRPTACSDNIHNDYSPGWTSSSLYHPFRWGGGGPATVVVRPRIAAVLY